MNPLNREIASLLYLLDDPDMDVYDNIKKKILSFGPKILPNLKVFRDYEDDDLAKNRLTHLIYDLSFEDTIKKVEYWKSGTKSLAEALEIVAGYFMPDRNFSNFPAFLHELRTDIWLELGIDASPFKNILVLNRIFFHRYGFELTNKGTLSEALVPNLLEHRIGSKLALQMLYATICELLNIPVHCMKLNDGEIYLAYLDAPFDPTRTKDYKGGVHFFIQPHLNGMILNVKDLEDQLTLEYDDIKLDFCFPMSSYMLLVEYLRRLQKDHYRNDEEIQSQVIRISTTFLD